MRERLGIVAGESKLPCIVAKNARESNVSHIYGVGFDGQTDPAFEQYVDECVWLNLGQLGKLIKFFKKRHVSDIVFIGRIAHKVVFKELKLDLRMIRMATKIRDWRTDSILTAIASEIESENITIIPSTTYLHNLLPCAGVLTDTKPSKQDEMDIQFGLYIAKKLAGLDIGQTVVVKKKTVLALEAIEGTDAAILRGGILGKDGIVVVKVSKPDQDMRFDVPVIGMTTLSKLKIAKASVLAIEAGKTLFMDKDEFIRQADRNKIAVVVIDPEKMDFDAFER